MKLKFRHFFNFPFLLELFLFSFTLYLSIGVALSIIRKSIQEPIVKAGNSLSGWQFLIMFLIATVILLLILKYFKRPWVIQGLFYVAIIEGMLFFNQAFFDWPGFLYVTAFYLILWLAYRNVAAHNFVIVIALSAISAIFGLNLAPTAVIVILVILAAYDFWAVYLTKHMVKMFRGMAQAKVHFALIIPQDFKGLFKKTKDVNPDNSFMFLGTGDIALPGFMVVSALQISQLASFFTLFGAVLGFVFLYILFITQKERAPMPGLPPIVMGTLLGYFIYFLL